MSEQQKKPEALRLAEALAYCDSSVAAQAALELRRLHASETTMQDQLAAIGAGGVESLRQPRACLHQISEPAAVAVPDERVAFEQWANKHYSSITPEMIEAAEEAYMPFGDMGLAIQCALAAAPQPTEAAPVQLPEPSAWMLGCQTMGGDVGWNLSWYKSGAGVCHRLSGKEFEHPLYTEQQVRALLATATGVPAQAVEMPEFDLRTSKGGRDLVAWYFANVLGRHDFAKYISNTLAADFACALAQALRPPQAQADARDAEPMWLQVDAEVRYWEDATVNGDEDTEGNLIPLKQGNRWVPVIRLTDGFIGGWPQGVSADIHYKVCDQGEYFLLNAALQRLSKYRSYYVPSMLSVGDNGYGDYIILKVNGEGFIEGWKQPAISTEMWEATDAAIAAAKGK